MSIIPALSEPRPALASPPRPRISGARAPMRLGLATGGLLWLCYFPAAWGWLAWVALVPLLALVRSPARSRTIYLSAFVGGLAFYLPALQWMRAADPRMYITWGVLAIYCALYFPLAIGVVRYLERRTALPLPVTVPIVWTALEFFRSNFATGFSWYLIGHSQHNWLPIIQIADITGAYGVSFLVVAVNAVILEALWQRPGCRRLLGRETDAPRWGRVAVAGQALAILVLFAGTAVYGVVRMKQAAFTAGPRVALVQGNLPQQIRNQAELINQVEKHYFGLSNVARSFSPDLIVWPETSFAGSYSAIVPGIPFEKLNPHDRKLLGEVHKMIEEVHERWPSQVLLGLNSYILQTDDKVKSYNSALLIDHRGHVAGRYDKMHRVPFGEYVPLRDVFPIMNRLAPYDYEYGVAAGESFTRFPVETKHGERPYTFGVVICYEDTVPDVASPYGGDGAHATDFLVNISNDGWFDGTSEHEEHLAICRFRAVECRRSVGRAVNMGISAVIDGNGRVLRPQEVPHPEHLALFAGAALTGSLGAYPWPALGMNRSGPHVWSIPAESAKQQELPPSEWREFKKTAGVLLATIPIDSRSSFYARHGDWLPWTCWGLLGAGLAFSRFRRREI